MDPFYGRGSSASRLEPPRGGSLLFTTKFPEISGTHFVASKHLKITPGFTKNATILQKKKKNE